MYPQFVVVGTARRFGEKQLNIEASNEAELRAFYAKHAPARKLDWAGGVTPLVTVSRSDLIAKCIPGDHVAYLFEMRPCADGPRAYGLDLWPASKN
jgi:hypothetical protein